MKPLIDRTKVSMLLVALILLTGAPAMAQQESGGPRCGSEFVQIGDRAFLVFERCGPPLEIQFVGIDTEEWVYGPVAGYYYFITFDRGRVIEIESERG